MLWGQPIVCNVTERQEPRNPYDSCRASGPVGSGGAGPTRGLVPEPRTARALAGPRAACLVGSCAGPGDSEAASQSELQSMFCHKGNHGLRGAGPGDIHVILSKLNAAAAGAAIGSLSGAQACQPRQGASGFLLVERQV